MASKIDAVCLALAAMWDATSSLAAVTVADGPQATADPLTDWLFVGYDGDRPSETEGATAEQSRLAMNFVKQEEGEITCAAVAVSGDTDITAARARASAIVSAAEDALRANDKLGGLVMQSELFEGRYFPTQTTDGAKVRFVFTVTYLAQL